jgi:RNA polymerase sigma-70 factor (ECF subfamily)
VEPSLLQQVDRARLGDTAAFEAVVRELESPLVRFVAAVLGGDVHAANDVVQDVLVATWHALPGLAEPDHLVAWVYRVAYRKAVSWRRRRRGPRGLPFVDIHGSPADGPPHLETFASRDASPERAFAAAEASPYLRAALSGLPPRYAAPLTLHHLEGLSLRETSRLLGVAVPTLKMRLHRARHLLRERLLAREPWTRHRRRDATPPAAPPCDPTPPRSPTP